MAKLPVNKETKKKFEKLLNHFEATITEKAKENMQYVSKQGFSYTTIKKMKCKEKGKSNFNSSSLPVWSWLSSAFYKKCTQYHCNIVLNQGKKLCCGL
jgi:hypothetical protein